MQSGNNESFLNPFQKSILILFFTLLICSLLAFKNLLFKPISLLKNFGDISKIVDYFDDFDDNLSKKTFNSFIKSVNNE